MNVSRLLIATLILACAYSKSLAQEFIGISTSNYSGIMGLELQPANHADNRLAFDVRIAGLNFAFGNNLLGLNPKFLVRDGGLTSEKYPLLDPAPGDKSLYLNPNFSDDRSAYMKLNLALPGFFMTIDEKSGASISMRLRTEFSLQGVDKELFDIAYNGLESTTLFDRRFTNTGLSLQTMTWMQYSLGYGRTIIEKDAHFLKAGLNLNILKGWQSAYAKINNLDFELTDLNISPDTVEAYVSIYDSDVQYGYSTNYEDPLEKRSFKPDAKWGLGTDIGFVYEWRPFHKKYRYDMDGETGKWMRNKEKYLVKFGASLLDLGGIRFKKGPGSGDFLADVRNLDVAAIKLSDDDPIGSIDTLVRKDFGQPTANDYKMHLPTAISTQLDIKVWKDFYINNTNFIPLNNSNDPNKLASFRVLTVAPRYDHKIFGITVPLSWHEIMGQQTGVAVRIGPLSFGTNNLNPIRTFVKADGTGNKDIKGLDFFFVLRAPIAHEAVSDRDNDKVSDTFDECPKVPGIWEFRGCPDRDGDHIKDSEDDCPDLPGPVELRGCPDKDGDMVPDLTDECPDTPGKKDLAGCPDRDDDGVADAKDDCPDVKGLQQFKGCPDTDGDGVTDNIDNCPEQKGLVQFNGCPDSDEDGVSDKADECPNEKGTLELGGCPDRDGDKVADNKDACPDQPGVAERKGCPAPSLTYFSGDIDRETVMQTGGVFSFLSDINIKNAKFKLSGYSADTIKTAFITAPNLRGKNAYKDSDGILRFAKESEEVQLKDDEKELMRTAFNNLEFQSGKDIIVATSYTGLDKVGELLISHPTWKLRISGHTDNVGKRDANMKLSKKRAEAVKKYLNSKGLPDSRFEVLAFGPDRPIYPNDTKEGQAKNRRVEMMIVE